MYRKVNFILILGSLLLFFCSSAVAQTLKIDGMAFTKNYIYGWSTKEESIYLDKRDKSGNPTGNWKKLLTIDVGKGIFKERMIKGIATLNDEFIYIFLTDSIQFSKINKDGSLLELKKASYTPMGEKDRIAGWDNIAAFSLYGRLYFFSGGFLITTINKDGDLNPWQKTTLPPIRSDRNAVAYSNGYFYVIGGQEGREIMLAKINANGTPGAWENTFSLPSGFILEDLSARGNKLFAIGTQSGKSRVLLGKIESDGSINEWKISSFETIKATPIKIIPAEDVGVIEAKANIVNYLNRDSQFVNVFINAHNPNILYAYDRKFKRLIRSKNKGTNWTEVVLEDMEIITIKQDSNDKKSFLVLTKNSLLKASDDGGTVKLKKIGDGLPAFSVMEWKAPHLNDATGWGISENLTRRENALTEPLSSSGATYLVIDELVYKSNDGGNKWLKRSKGLKNKQGLIEDYVEAIYVSPPGNINETETIYTKSTCWKTGTSNMCAYISKDGGATWNRDDEFSSRTMGFTVDPSTKQNIGYIFSYTIEKKETDKRVLVKKMEVAKVIDGMKERQSHEILREESKNREEIENKVGYIYDFIINPQNTEEVVLSTSNNIYKTIDGGSTWVKISDKRAYAIAADPLDFAKILTVGDGYIEWIDATITEKEPITPAMQSETHETEAPKEAVETSTPSEKRMMRINVTYTDLYAKPSFFSSFSPLRRLPKNTEVEYLSEEGSYTKVKLQDGTIGWIFSRQLEDVK